VLIINKVVCVIHRHCHVSLLLSCLDVIPCNDCCISPVFPCCPQLCIKSCHPSWLSSLSALVHFPCPCCNLVIVIVIVLVLIVDFDGCISYITIEKQSILKHNMLDVEQALRLQLVQGYTCASGRLPSL
jgi:hypothetical protein